MGQVAEGVNTLSMVVALADAGGVSMPIASEVDGVINDG